MMIDAHPAVAVPPETGFLTALADLDPATDIARAAWETMTGFHTWPDFHIEPAALRARLDRDGSTPADAARAFYRLYAERFGKDRFGDKTPAYGNAMDRIASLLPEARFVHIIRDGRDVTLSVRRLWFRPGDSVEACAADWSARLARARALGSQVPHYLEIRYERLVTFPEETLESICRFLELRFDPLMLTYHTRAPARLNEHEARHDADGRLVVAKAQRLDNQRYVTEPPRLDRIGRWKKEMNESEVLRFDAVAGEWLDRLGYDRGR
jgi:hypothetical protein